MLSARAAALKKEYDRTHADPTINIDVTKNLETHKDPAYLVGCRNAIFATVENPRYRSAHQILPSVATMFMTMASEALASNSSISRFSIWANAFSGVQKRELVRFAYIATVWEQEQSGSTDPVSFATRILLMTLAANANDDPTSKEMAREMFSYVDRLQDPLKNRRSRP